MDNYAVAGNPISHSLSPWIHMRFAEQTGETLRYERLFVPEGEFDQIANRFFESGGHGLNITLPCKLDAYNYAQRLTDRAKDAGAVNTLIKENDGCLLGDNTDGQGLVTDLRTNLGWQIAGARVLIIGAGGAVRGVIGPLLSERPAELVVSNRTVARARELINHFGGGKTALSATSLLELMELSDFDLIINATSAGLSGTGVNLPDRLFARNACAYDLAYGEGAEPFITAAKRLGVTRYSDGIGMLVEQAAESFFRWRGVRPDSSAVLRALQEKPKDEQN